MDIKKILYAETLYLDKEVFEAIKKYGDMGIYIIHIKRKGLCIYIDGEALYPDEVSDEEIYKYVEKLPKLREQIDKKVYKIITDRDVNEEAVDIINSTNNINPLLLIMTTPYNIDTSAILRLLDNENVFVEDDVFKDGVDLNVLSILEKASQKGRLIKKQYNHETGRDEYITEDDIHVDKITIKIDNTTDIRSYIKTIKSVCDRINSGIADYATIEVKVTDIRYLGAFQSFYSEFEDYPYDHIKYNLILDDLGDKIEYNRIYTLDREQDVTVTWNDINFESFGEFLYFQTFVKIALSKITPYATDLDKVVYISNFIIQYFRYDTENYEKELKGIGEVPTRSLPTLVSCGIGVCADYARLTEYLLKKVGVRCEYIGSTTYDYEQDKGTGKIKYSESGHIIDSKYISHAFNIVYIDGIPYYLDNTWISKDTPIWKSPYFLVSTEDFQKTHGEYVEVEKHDCPQTYPRAEISNTEKFISNYWLDFNEDDIRILEAMHHTVFAHKIREGVFKK